LVLGERCQCITETFGEAFLQKEDEMSNGKKNEMRKAASSVKGGSLNR
jgi:hypothetical protein